VHQVNLKKLKDKEKEQELIGKIIDDHRDTLLAEVGKAPRGDSISKADQIFRMEVTHACWADGIPLYKMDGQSRLRGVIEGPGGSTGGRTGLGQTQKPLANALLKAVGDEVGDRPYSAFCDGSKINDIVEVFCIRTLNEAYDIIQRLAGASMVSKSLNGESLKTLFKKHLQAAGLSLEKLVATIVDSASVNKKMIKSFNDDAELEMTEKLKRLARMLAVFCVSHGFSNTGGVLKERCPQLKRFMKGFKKMVNTSDTSRMLFKEISGLFPKQLADNRWVFFFCFKFFLFILMLS